MWVAQQMGHSDWTMIARVYGRWMPSADIGAGGKAVAIWGNVSNVLNVVCLDENQVVLKRLLNPIQDTLVSLLV